MIRSLLAALVFCWVSAAHATAVDPVIAQMKIDSQAGKSSYQFEWREVRGVGSLNIKWLNYDPATHSVGYDLQNARIKVLIKPLLPAGCRFDLWSAKINANGLNSTIGFRVAGVSCKDALQELAKGDFALEFYHVPELNSSNGAVVPQLNLVIDGQ